MKTWKCHLLLSHFHFPLSGIFSPVFTEEWKISVAEKLDALVSSCVVFPCSFTTPKLLPTTKLRGIWHFGKEKENIIYHEDRTRVMENYRSRTRLLGRLGDDNCTLEMTEVRDHDNGPFCFRVELAENDKPTDQMHSFVHNCVELKMIRMSPTWYSPAESTSFLCYCTLILILLCL